MKKVINNYSEIAPLKKILLHKPGNEYLNLTPNTLQRLLFDDIPYLKISKLDDLRKICTMIESHMGEWTVDPYTKKEVLPKPRTAEQRFVHMCDYLASRKFLDVKFLDNDIVG